MSKRIRRVLAVMLCLGLAFSCLSGCTSGQEAVDSEDILSQKTPLEGRTQISVLVKYSFFINAFEQAVEKAFPDIDLVQVGNYTGKLGVEEYEKRLQHDDLTDIVMTWPLDVGEEYWADRLLDLSGMPFTGRYNTSMLDSISRDGKLYYLPGPAQVRGIVYNKTLFAENGWVVPEDFAGFVKLCEAIESSGIRSLQLGFLNPEVLDTAFVGFGYAESFSTLQDAQFLDDYNSGAGSFGARFAPALDTFQTMIDAGIWRASDLEVRYPMREEMFFNRQCAMIEDSVLTLRKLEARGSGDEYALMPFFSDGEPSDWARLQMVCYIGLNKHLAEPENKGKYDLAMKLMDYISTPEGQTALAADTGAMYSSIKGIPAPNIPEIKDLQATLDAGRSTIFPELKNAQSALRRGLAGMLSGTMTKKDVIRMVDEENQSPPKASGTVALGEATADFNLIETGNLITDAMRKAAGSDFALFLDNGKDGRDSGKGVNGKFYQGPVTADDVTRVLPLRTHGEEGILQIITVTGAELKRTLEYSIDVEGVGGGWFYYFSGLKMTYNPAGEPGSRIQKITMDDGKDIVADKVYTVAVMDGSYPEEFISTAKNTGHSMNSLLAEYIQKQGAITPSGDGRFQIGKPQGPISS